jgi:hypothetical protein
MMIEEKKICVIRKIEGAFQCVDLAAARSRSIVQKDDNFIIVKGDLPSYCPFLAITGQFERLSSKCFVLTAIHSIDKLKLSKKNLYKFLLDDSGKKILTTVQRAALNTTAQTVEQCLRGTNMAADKMAVFNIKMKDFFEFDKNDRFRLASLLPKRLLDHLGVERCNELFNILQETPWKILFDTFRESIGLRGFKDRVSYEAVERWHVLFGEGELPFLLKGAFDLYEATIEEQDGVACDVRMPCGPALGWLLSNGIVASPTKTLTVSLESDARAASLFSKRLSDIKDNVFLVQGLYTDIMRDFLEKKFGDFVPIVASPRLEMVLRTTGHGRVFNNIAAPAAITVFAGLDSIPVAKFIRWIEDHGRRTGKIVLTGTISAQRFRLFECLLEAWPEKVLDFTAPASRAPEKLFGAPEDWYRVAKSKTGAAVVVTDDQNVEFLCEQLGKDPNAFKPGDVVRYKNREYKVASTYLYTKTRGKLKELDYNIEVKTQYHSQDMFAEVSYKARGIDPAKHFNLEKQTKNGLKHAICIGISEFVERVPTVVLATSSISAEQLQYAATKADKVFYVGDIVEQTSQPPRKRRKFNALSRLL